MSSTVEEVYDAPAGKYLMDFHEDWARAEGVPVFKGAAVDLNTLETRDWARLGARGAMCHLEGRCDFLSVFVLELAAQKWSAPQHHLYEEICYVVSGSGETEIELSGGAKRTIAWRAGSLFSAPMNARYRHRASATARLACFNDIRYLLNLYRNERFLFETPVEFPERGEGEVAHDLTTLPVGAGVWAHERATPLALAKGSIGADVVEIPAGKYGQARRQTYGSLALCIAGEGMSISWADADGPRVRTPWKPGTLFAPAGLSFHQHFNVGAETARFLRVEFGTTENPILRPRMRAYGDLNVYAAGSAEIAYKDEAPELRREWLEILKKAGVASRM